MMATALAAVVATCLLWLVVGHPSAPGSATLGALIGLAAGAGVISRHRWRPSRPVLLEERHSRPRLRTRT